MTDHGQFDDHTVNKNVNLPLKFVRGVSYYAATNWIITGTFTMTGYTSYKVNIENSPVIFCTTSNYGDDRRCYDWCLVEWLAQNNVSTTYPGRILGFINLHSNTFAVIQSSCNTITMEQLTDDFVCKFDLDESQQTYVVDVETISSALFVYRNYGGACHSYFCALPKRKWGWYFRQKV